MSKIVTEETARLWAIEIVENTPFGWYRTEEERKQLENFVDRVCKKLLEEEIKGYIIKTKREQSQAASERAGQEVEG